jgi:hypothetical protein
MLSTLSLLASLAFQQVALEAVPTELAPLVRQVRGLALHASNQPHLEKALTAATRATEAEDLQEKLDPAALLEIRINPEGRVKVARGLGATTLETGKPIAVLVKVVNGSGGQQRLKPILKCPGEPTPPVTAAWLEKTPGLGQDLNGLLVEYRLLLLTGQRPGLFEITFAMEAGQGTQDLGFRGETPLLVRVKP